MTIGLAVDTNVSPRHDFGARQKSDALLGLAALGRFTAIAYTSLIAKWWSPTVSQLPKTFFGLCDSLGRLETRAKFATSPEFR